VNAIKNAKLKSCIEKKRLLVNYPYTLDGVMRSILKKNHAEVIYEDFGEKIDIQVDIDVELADSFIDIVKRLSAGNAQIIMAE